MEDYASNEHVNRLLQENKQSPVETYYLTEEQLDAIEKGTITEIYQL